MIKLFVSLCLFISAQALSVDLSNPTKFMFVGDKTDNVIDVVELSSNKVVYRLKTEYKVDRMVVAPYTPLLFYTNLENKQVIVYDLKAQKVTKTIQLNMTPRNMVLDTTGSRIGLSDSEEGGFVLLSVYQQAIIFQLDDFPATGDVLFDPNEIDIYYSGSQKGVIGIIDTNDQQAYTMELEDGQPMQLSSPSRSLDGRHVYVANQQTGEVYGINAYSRIIYKTFNIGDAPARPYTTPEGSFLYLMDEESGKFVSYEQSRFTSYADVDFEQGIDLVTVGRFDRINVFLSTQHRQYSLFDNLTRKIIGSGEFDGTPVAALASADGKTTYVAFKDTPKIAVIELESGDLDYLSATNNGVHAFALGLSNTVCH